MSQQNCAVVLAAGEGKRMKRERPKALSPVLFKPMLQWVLDSARGAGIESACVVTGYLHEQVERYLLEHDPETGTVLQSQRKGTGHAVMMAADFLRAHSAGCHTLILNGDAPFIGSGIIREALEAHIQSGNAVTVISAALDDPTGYGRIIRDRETHLVSAIVEQKDATPEQRAVREVNSGAYWFRTDDLLDVLTKIRSDNAQGEYYLTDAVGLLIAEGKKADAYTAGSAEAVLGANDCVQLAELNAIARDRILLGHLREGTDIPCRDGVVIGPDVTIGKDVCILPGTVLQGKVSVGRGCTIGPNTVVIDCAVGEGSTLRCAVCTGGSVPPGTEAVPFTVLNNAD